MFSIKTTATEGIALYMGTVVCFECSVLFSHLFFTVVIIERNSLAFWRGTEHSSLITRQNIKREKTVPVEFHGKFWARGKLNAPAGGFIRRIFCWRGQSNSMGRP